MKRIIWMIALLCSLTVQAQDMKSLFIALPDSLSPLLTKVNREDFGDFLESNMKAEVKNRFGKASEMLKLTDDYLLLEVTSASRAEMKLLPLNDSVKVICVVQTYRGPAADSRVSFYDTSWKELDATRFLNLPKEDDFYRAPATEAQADSLRNLRMRADMYLLEARLSETGRRISFIYSTLSYMDEETSKEMKPYLVDKPVAYEWKNGRFE